MIAGCNVVKDPVHVLRIAEKMEIVALEKKKMAVLNK